MSYFAVLASIVLVLIGFFLWKLARKRNWVWKVLAGSGCALLGISSVGLGLWFLFMHLMCGQYVSPEVLSPAGGAVARITEFDCGAMDGFHSSVELRSNQRKLTASGLRKRLFFSEVFAAEQSPTLIGLSWTGEHELLIQYSRLDPHHLASFHCEPSWQEIRINCQAVDTPPTARVLSLSEPYRWLW
jgi:hypothetical protein